MLTGFDDKKIQCLSKKTKTDLITTFFISPTNVPPCALKKQFLRLIDIIRKVKTKQR